MAAKKNTNPKGRADLDSLNRIAREVVECERCPRLRDYCEEVARVRRKSFAAETYWARPVPAFGDPHARVLLVGLAPAAHGGNRTGRVFTGDRSGDFLYAALYRAGFASQPLSRSRNDGLRLHDTLVTASVRCAPPANKPLPVEFERCRPYLVRELQTLQRLRVVVTLGRLGHDQLLQALKELGIIERRSLYPFGHGVEYEIDGVGRHLRLIGCYHPSQQNTFTGKLTAAMLDAILARARAVIAPKS